MDYYHSLRENLKDEPMTEEKKLDEDQEQEEEDAAGQAQAVQQLSFLKKRKYVFFFWG